MSNDHRRARMMPKASGYSREIAMNAAGKMNMSDPSTIVDALVITAHYCPGCGLPHIMKLSSTTHNPEAIIAILGMVITDIIETYDDDQSSTGPVIIFGGE